jgi:hypothetical protein
VCADNAAAVTARAALNTRLGYPKNAVRVDGGTGRSLTHCCSISALGTGASIYELSDVGRPAGLTRGGALGDRACDWLYGWPSAAGTPRRPFVVYAILGQSNGKRSSDTGLNGGVDISDAWALTQNGGDTDALLSLFARQANEVLPHPNPRTNEISFSVALARKHLCAHWDALGYDVMFVCKSEASTGFGDDRWGVGDDLFEDAVGSTSGIAWALAILPDAIFGGCLWSIGEKDSSIATSAASFEAALDASCARIDTLFGAAPMTFLGMAPVWVTSIGAAATAIQTVLADVGNRRALSAYADPTGIDTTGADPIHYSCANHRGTEDDSTVSTSRAVWEALETLLL